MATGIPLPGQPINSLMTGVNTGSSMFSRIMQPIIERQKMAQQAEQFKQDIALRKAAAARAGANSDIQRQVLQEQLLGLKHKNDPNWELQQFLNQTKMFGGGGGTTTPTTPAPQEEFGEGQGMFTPEGLQDAQQVPESSSGSMGGIDPAIFKQNPMLRGFFKHKFGVDPLELPPQTPEEKNAMAIDLFKQKEAIKKGSGDTVPATTAIKTKLQSVVTGVDNALPVIKDLITDFKNLPTGSETLNPSSYAAYDAKANSIIEPLINAFGLNVTDATKAMMHEQVFRRTNEPLNKYRDRLVTLAKDIIKRRNDSFQSLKSGSINPKSEFTEDLFEGLKGETKVINGIKYQKLNGEWHEVQ